MGKMMNRIHPLSVLEYRGGYIIGATDEEGRVICQVTRKYRDKERAEKELVSGEFISRDYCKDGCERCIFKMEYDSWGIYEEKELDVIRFGIVENEDTALGRLNREGKVYIEVVSEDDNIEEYRVVGECGREYDYSLSKSEKGKVLDWVYQLGNALNVYKGN